MAVQTLDLWTLTRGRPQIDPNDLADAITAQASEADLDYRTRLLIRDGVCALRSYWGENKVSKWLSQIASRQAVLTICQEPFEETGFPSLRRRLMEKTKPEDIKEFLRELGTKINRPITVIIVGSVALILTDYLSRNSEDIDVVDEVPKEIRDQHELLEKLHSRFGLHVRHFQQHYLPSGWHNRLHSIESFGHIRVFLVDPIDVFMSKLTSVREKDLDDLRALKPQLDKSLLIQRLKDSMVSMLASESLRERAQQNWYILFGEDLPQ